MPKPTQDPKLNPKVKPALRGVSHKLAAVGAAAAGAVLVASAPDSKSRIAAIIYAISLTIMLTISATYHIPTWTPSGRAVMRRFDHAGIYLIIAATYTPFCMLALDDATSSRILKLVWSGASAGILLSMMAPKKGFASKALSATLYVVLGWVMLPYASQLKAAVGGGVAGLVVAGGVVYSLGAVIYALRWPDPYPEVFGYHELFHAAVILAATLHFMGVHSVVINHPRNSSGFAWNN